MPTTDVEAIRTSLSEEPEHLVQVDAFLIGEDEVTYAEYLEFLDLAERYDSVMLDTTMSFTPFIEEGGAPFPAAELPRLRDLGDRVLFGTDFPNIPHSYPDALEALEMTGLGTRANPLAVLRSFASARRGRITYGELSRRLDVGRISSRAVSYMGFATKAER